MPNPNIADVGFKPGHPGYRKKGTRNKKTIERDFIEFCKQTIKEPDFQKAIRDRAKRQAPFTRIVTDYGAGRPTERVSLSGPDDKPLKIILQVRKEGDVDDGNL